jgi:hypothetical protein
MHLAHYLALLERSQSDLADAFRAVARAHADDVDIEVTCTKLARQCDRHAEQLRPFVTSYRDDAPGAPDRLHGTLFAGTREGGLGLLRDLHDLYLLASECDISWTLIGQAAQGARDRKLLEFVQRSEGETSIQLAWLAGRMKQAAPQALVVSA